MTPGAHPLAIRPARPADAPAIAALYNAGIRERTATFETRERTLPEIEAWLADPLPLLVGVLDGAVVGYARIGRYSAREAYAGVGEHSVYVDRIARGAGVARRLLEALAAAGEAHGLHKLSSRVFADNGPSRRAHAAAGFTEIGTHRRHARLDGEWKDCVIVERLLGEAARLPEDRAG